jgi:hypothetical protein
MVKLRVLRNITGEPSGKFCTVGLKDSFAALVSENPGADRFRGFHV